MESFEASNRFLKKKYGLDESKEVKAAAIRTKGRTGKWPQRDPLSRIENYFKRFHEITDRTDPVKREHGLDAAKRILYHKYVIKPDEIPESYFDNQRRLAREEGHGDIEIPPQVRKQLTDVIIADQKSSLDRWVDYFSSPNFPYSDGLKYFALRNVLTMSEYDKERKAYPNRSTGTTKPFPDLNPEALAYVFNAIDRKYKGQAIDLSRLEAGDKQQYEMLLASENFAKLYAFEVGKLIPASPEQLAVASGEWVKYNQGSDATSLVGTLENQGTGWCTAEEFTAQKQLEAGDFHVYYSFDKEGKPTIPRAAIRMKGDKIAEVRGVALHQNLDPGIVEIVEKKLNEFPDGLAYKKRVSDMKRVTEIDRQISMNQQLTVDDLAFLHEIGSYSIADKQIRGFGFYKDPRIERLQRRTRKQIAYGVGEITNDTKVYAGIINSDAISMIRENNIRDLYDSFGRRRGLQTLTVGDRRTSELLKDVSRGKFKVSPGARKILQRKDLARLAVPESLDLIILNATELSTSNMSTHQEIYATAQRLGLELCPPETAMYLRLAYTDQAENRDLYIATEGFPDSKGKLRYLTLVRRGEDLLLSDAGDHSGFWTPDAFVFCLPKKT